jgi:enediyne biosynthesis protein E11
MTAQPDVYVQLTAQGEEVDRLVAELDAASWELPTPAPGWTVAHQIAHLAATFRIAETAVSAPDDFRAFVASLGGDFDANVRRALGAYLAEPREVLLKKWRAERAAVDEALAKTPPMQIVPWLVRPLPAAVLAAAGTMELFAHGQDIADALGVRRTHGDGIRHLVDFVSRTWDFGYQSRGLATPDIRLRFEVTAPSGDTWTYGADDATDVISGPAVDLCLLATRRRHRADLALTGAGAQADRWLDIAQAYRGPAGEGRRPGQFGH